ncbi:MAG TPA: phospho-N-acetylmuramoyl-pentapeptide-transferase, partial [Spirochaetota bacterium]|nr:phospho-N-acetylmuramoyl-pentapeptide-transferase [Spirochaetota bacterium]
MLYYFILPLKEYLGFLRLFQYITFRSAYAALTSLLLVLILGNLVIRWLRALKLGEEIRALGPESHKLKAGTPTMGGIIIIGAVLGSIALWGNFASPYLIILSGATVALGGLGFADDYIKSILKRKEGVSAKVKLLVQMSVALAVALLVYYLPSNKTEVSTLYVP